MKKTIAFVMSDLHARQTAPRARVDQYFEAMVGKLDFIRRAVEEEDALLIDCGDLFDKWKSTPKVESVLLEKLPDDFYSVAGNHEMPYHNVEKLFESSFNVLLSARKIVTGKYTFVLDGENRMPISHHIQGLPYSKELPKPGKLGTGINIAVFHGMVWKEKPAADWAEGIEAKDLQKIFKGFDFVFCGHNHETFVLEGKPTIINPGSVMRSSISQINHKPCIFRIFDDCTFGQVFIPIKEGVFNEQEYVKKSERDSRMEAFVEKLKSPDKVTLDFKSNLLAYIKKNKVPTDVSECIEKILGEINV